jgi:hypothetical protein
MAGENPPKVSILGPRIGFGFMRAILMNGIFHMVYFWRENRLTPNRDLGLAFFPPLTTLDMEASHLINSNLERNSQASTEG